MSTELSRKYLKNIRLRYHQGSKKQKTLILDEYYKVCGLTRKHAIKLLSASMPEVPRRPGPVRKYGDVVDGHLRHLWECMGRINSKKMSSAMIDWLPFYGEADERMKKLLMEISPSTIDRPLEQFRPWSAKNVFKNSIL